jgi:carbohydrate-selective porin OprB
VELEWLPTFGGGTLPDSYKIGAWYDTSNAPNVVDVVGTVAVTNPSVPVVSSQGRYRGYINFEQQVTRNGTSNSRGGLSLFLTRSLQMTVPRPSTVRSPADCSTPGR